MDTLFTLGYQGHSIATFLDVLRAHGIATLIDVRERPFSRKPDFGKKRLAAHLAAEGVAYHHLAALGTPKPIRDEVRRSKDYPAFFAAVRPLVEAEEGALAEAIALARAAPSALLCYEGPVATCHRLQVAEAMARRAADLRVIHL